MRRPMPASTAAPGTGGERDKAAYLADIDGIVYGEDPSEGFVRGRRFLHPKLGFTFTAPDGFVLDNTAQAVLGVKHGGGQALRLDVVRVPAEQTLAGYLTSGWIDNIDAQHAWRTSRSTASRPRPRPPRASSGSSGSMPSASAATSIASSSPPRRRTPEMDRIFRESVGTFRRMSLAEIEQAKPLRLRVLTVGPGDTVERLASRMAVPDRALERFRVLNGLEPGDKLKPGSQVKIAVE